MKYLANFILIFLLGYGAATAQQSISDEAKSGTFYSLFGVGFPVDGSTAEEKGMGIFGVSMNGAYSAGLTNPAYWGTKTFAVVSTGFNMSYYLAEDSFTSNTNLSIAPNFFQSVFPLKPGRLSASASIYPVTRSNFRVFDSNTIYPGPVDTVSYVTDIRSVGGINKLEVGLGWKLNKNILIGYAPAFVFMSSNNTESIFFESNEYTSNEISTDYTGYGFGHRFGTLLTFGNVLNNRDRVNIGGAVTLPVSFEAERKSETEKSVQGNTEIVELEGTRTGDVKLPVEINTGITYFPNNLVNVSLEGKFHKWDDYRNDLKPSSENLMTNRLNVGLGGQYHPYKLGSDKFLTKFKYSFGVSYDSGHLTINNEDISTLWLSTGVGLGINNQRSRYSSTVDLSLQYGLRGTTASNLVQERIWAINLSINLGELMFFRPKLN